MLRHLNVAKRALVRKRHYQNITRDGSALAVSPNIKYSPGDVIHGFRVDEIHRIRERDLDAVMLTHLSTGASYLHLNKDDSNNVFSVNLRTIPKDSTGVAHILEHTVLCGSQQYPCKDPFFKMHRRSLATYMNAQTGPDFTSYPMATQNPKDFQNLQSLYLDTVFRPNLRELDFRQEGWRLEHTDVHDKKSPIIFKGVVFNEMKGAYDENESCFGQAMMSKLLPSGTYGHCSGGEPLVIPELTHEALIKFHSKHYHPSNAKFYSYGNFPFEPHLQFVEQNIREFEKIDVSDTIVPPEKRWTAPRRAHITCKPNPMVTDTKDQHVIAISYLCNDIKDIQTSFDLFVLQHVLLEGPNSVVYQNLIEKKLARSFGVPTGFDMALRDTMFSVCFKDVKSENFDKIEKIFDSTLHKVVEEEFSGEAIVSVVRRIELALKHQDSNEGLNILYSIRSLWNHDGDVVGWMRIDTLLNNFLKRCRYDSKYLNTLVKTYLIDNKHRLTLTMSPDENYEKRQYEDEKKLLKSKIEALSDTELAKIYEDGQTFLAHQQQQEEDSEDVLPSLKIEDLKPDAERHEISEIRVCGVPVQISVQPTNGLSYYHAIFNTQDFKPELKELLPIFNVIVGNMGTKKYDYRSLSRMIELNTGGLEFKCVVIGAKDSTSQFEEGIELSSFCQDKMAENMWEICEEVINRVTLKNIERFDNLLLDYASRMNSNIPDDGHMYVMSAASSFVSEARKLLEKYQGLEQIMYVNNIMKKNLGEELLEQMQQIRQNIFLKKRMRSSLNVSQDQPDQMIRSMNRFYNMIEGNSLFVRLFGNPRTYTTAKNTTSTEERAIHHVMPYTVNYTSKAILTVPFVHPDYPVLQLLAAYLSEFHLFPELRVKGGAYGGFANLSHDGIFTFASYRDPNSTRTFDVYDNSYDCLRKMDISQKSLDQAKLTVFQKVDYPTPPYKRGTIKFLHNIDYDDLQVHRRRLMQVTREQLLDVAEKYLDPGKKGLRIGRALLGPANSEIQKRTSERWNVVEHDNLP